MNSIAEHRKKNKINQEQLAAALGVSAGCLSHYETGRSNLKVDTCWQIVFCLNKLGADCKFNELFPPPQSKAA